ncbi:cobalamin B12-binding domain-containing protein [Glacieibacterium sp.]|uniref:cobalamin B12-binding domain-containing protein n=1 Tax=Glacieibacterium sp. TaxID=2860237 RepID=UPI003B007992
MASMLNLHSFTSSPGLAQEPVSWSPTDLSPFALARIVEGEIIPRLLMAHRAPEQHDARIEPQGAVITALEAERFAGASLRNEAYALLVEVDLLLARGVSIETVFLDLLAPAAHQLGIWWEQDVCDFVDVTMGLWRLQEIVHELAARAPGAAERRGGERRALFAPLPGEQHGFGTLMVEEFFRRAGWTTASEINPTEDDLVSMVRKGWFELVGLTVSCEDHISRVPTIIGALRRASRNPRIGVMVGGRVFAEHPELAKSCGADATAVDARRAVLVAETLLDVLALRADTPIAGHG